MAHSLEGTSWSRIWGSVALAAFALHLGGAVFEAVVFVPLWMSNLPASAAAFAANAARPDAARFFHPLAFGVFFATALAWFSSLSTRGRRRLWLSLAMAAALALLVIAFGWLDACERDLFGAAAVADKDGATIHALAGDWMRAAGVRMLVLLVGAAAALRAHATVAQGGDATAPSSRGTARASSARPEPVRSRRAAPPKARDFSFGDDAEDDGIEFGDDADDPRSRWQGSLPRRPGRRPARRK